MVLAEMDLGGLLGFFVTLLIFFGVDFHLTRKRSGGEARGSVVWLGVSAVGEVATAVALLLTWISMFLSPRTATIDGRLVFAAGTLAAVCAVALTIEAVVHRVGVARRELPAASPSERSELRR